MPDTKPLPVVAWLKFCKTLSSLPGDKNLAEPWPCAYWGGTHKPALEYRESAEQFEWRPVADHADATARITELQAENARLTGERDEAVRIGRQYAELLKRIHDHPENLMGDTLLRHDVWSAVAAKEAQREA